MQIRAWKDPEKPTYLVQVGDNLYEMNRRANLPNGICIYMGKASDLAWTIRDKPVNDIPLGIVHQILNIYKADQ